ASASVCAPGPQPTSRMRGRGGRFSIIAKARAVLASLPGPSRGKPSWIFQKNEVKAAPLRLALEARALAAGELGYVRRRLGVILRDTPQRRTRAVGLVELGERHAELEQIVGRLGGPRIL